MSKEPNNMMKMMALFPVLRFINAFTFVKIGKLQSAKCKKILIAPLDWGLGHTTRCVPIIRYLLSQEQRPVFAGNEWQRNFINKTFSNIETIHLDGYNVRYGKTNSGFLYSLLLQVPRIYKTIRAEHKWLIEKAEEEKFDGIISDNRYGLFHPDIPSIVMTHQLEIQSGMGSMADKSLQKVHYRYLQRFNECWVPDAAGSPNLSGKLGHPNTTPSNTYYIGLLSQLDVMAGSERDNSLLILLSGPEPQRSMLSSLLWEQLYHYTGTVHFVEGSNEAVPPKDIPEHVRYHKQLNRTELLPLLSKAGMVICRSGYSTLMDLLRLKQKAILIPTPGQTEQEYLGRYLHE
ncbi:MAG: hypothetical protein JSS96_14755, partial [Bacteroidetes bacterium]|nr:hypothetical protein [Bacteroidota bacterium]